ncbi:MAG: hypothetical protein ACFE8M_03540 [Candidatus Hermodarchaeota archaeon]
MSILNYFRAFVYIFGLGFVPGSLIYRIIFKKDTLPEKFNINPFFIKITIYPLISFGFIGISVLILDQINIDGELIGIFLLSLILGLFLGELILKKKRNHLFSQNIIKISFSKFMFIILILAIGVSTISIGFQINWEYLISGDPWDAIKYAIYVGNIEKSPLYIDSYPNFWGYISFGLSNLGGLPYININTLLAPFSYLFVTSIYLLMKALLYHFKTKYVVLSTLLMSIFSGLLINPLVSTLIFVGEYYFIYKSLSYSLFFVSIAIFIIILKSYWYDKKRVELLMLIGLTGFLLVISFMTYIYPLFFGVVFLFIYCLFSSKNRKFINMKYYCYLILFIITLLLIFDLIMGFYLSYILISRFLGFFHYDFLINILSFIPAPILVYSLYLVFILIIFVITIKFSKKNKIMKKLRFKLDFRFILIIILLLCSLEFISILLEYFFLNLNLSNEFFFFLFLDKVFLNLGMIGILGVCLSYYCWKRDKFLFLILSVWILISFILAFIKPLIQLLETFPLSPEFISENDFFIMDYWFERLWIYSIPSLCIFASIGLLELFKKIKVFKIFNKIRISPTISKNIIALILFFSSFSGIIITGFDYGNPNFRYTETQIETLDWISKNIPIHSGIIVGDNFFMGVGTDSITFIRQYFFYEIFKADFNETKCVQQIGFLKNATIQYAVISQFFISYFLNKSDFTNNILIPNFYNVSLYQNGDLSVYYAPYFS